MTFAPIWKSRTLALQCLHCQLPMADADVLPEHDAIANN